MINSSLLERRYSYEGMLKPLYEIAGFCLFFCYIVTITAILLVLKPCSKIYQTSLTLLAYQNTTKRKTTQLSASVGPPARIYTPPACCKRPPPCTRQFLGTVSLPTSNDTYTIHNFPFSGFRRGGGRSSEGEAKEVSGSMNLEDLPYPIYLL